MEIYEKLGKYIKEERLKRRLTSTVLSDMARVNRTILWRIESGKSATNFHTLVKILSAMGIKIIDLEELE